jgi:hypothetical protein
MTGEKIFKKKAVSQFLFLWGCLMSSVLIAQQAFEGKIVYEMSYPTTMEYDSVTMKMVPKEKTTVAIFIKGDKMRMETVTPLGVSSNICDGKAKTSVVLTEVDGQKKAIYMDAEEMEEEDEEHLNSTEKPQMLKSTETNEILGYVCKIKEGVLSKKGTEKVIIYYTDQIKSSALNNNIYWIQRRFKPIRGLVLSYEIINEKQQLTFKIIAKKISLEPLNNNLFIIPSDYKIENLKKH